MVALGKLPPPDEKSFSKNVDYVMDRAVDLGLLTVTDVKEVAKQMSTDTGMTHTSLDWTNQNRVF